MYEADGKNLSKSQYEALCRLAQAGGEADSEMLGKARSSLSEKAVYAELEGKGLVCMCHDPDGRLLRIGLRKRSADDWFAAYEAAEAEKKRLSRREVKLAVWNTLGGALAGGLVAWALYALFGIA